MDFDDIAKQIILGYLYSGVEPREDVQPPVDDVEPVADVDETEYAARYEIAMRVQDDTRSDYPSPFEFSTDDRGMAELVADLVWKHQDEFREVVGRMAEPEGDWWVELWLCDNKTGEGRDAENFTF